MATSTSSTTPSRRHASVATCAWCGPISATAELFCYLASVGHWHDVGGAVPGNYNPAATEAFQEAFILPPVRSHGRCAAAGHHRHPDAQHPPAAIGDGRPQRPAGRARPGCEASRRAARRIRRRDRLRGARRPAGPGRGADAVGTDRAAGRRWEAEDFLDNDGITDTPLPIRVALEISGDRMVLDFEGTAPATAGPVNIALPTAVACCYVAIKHIFPDLPANAGVMRPIEIRVPDKSLLSAEFPAPVGGYTETILRMIDVIFSAAAQARPTGLSPMPTARSTPVDRRQARQRPALGDVQLLRRRPRRLFRKRRPEPRQCADLDRDDPAAGDPGSRLSGDVPRNGRCAPTAPGPGPIGAASARSTRSNCWRNRPRRSCSGSAAGSRPGRCRRRQPGAMNVFDYQQEDGWHRPPHGLQDARHQLSEGAGGAVETPGGGGYGPPGPRPGGRGPRRGTGLPERRGGHRRLWPRLAGGAADEPDDRRRCRRHLHRRLRSRRGTGTAKSPRCRRRGPTSRAVSSTESARVDDLRRSGPWSTAPRPAPTRLLERKGARIGVITTEGCATSWRCAAATGRGPGACAAISSRWCRATCGSRCRSARWPTVRSTRRWTSTPCAPPRGSCWTRAARRSRSSSPMPMPTRRTRPVPWRRCARSGPIRTCLFLGDPAGNPRVRALLDNGPERLSAAGGQRLPRPPGHRACARAVLPASS
jgi:N-methylhydantoinase B